MKLKLSENWILALVGWGRVDTQNSFVSQGVVVFLGHLGTLGGECQSRIPNGTVAYPRPDCPRATASR